MWMSSCGTRSGRPPIRGSRSTAARPSWMRQMSVDVPPMSNVIRSRYSAISARRVAARTPAAGPESSIRCACSEASRADMTPLDDCMMNSGQPTPSPSSPRSSRRRSGPPAAGRRRRWRSSTRAGTRGSRGDLGADARPPGRAGARAGRRPRAARGRGSRKLNSRQTATASTSAPAITAATVELAGVELPHQVPVAVDALGDLEDQLARHQRRLLTARPGRTGRGGLVADLEDVAEALGDHQRGAREAQLEQGVGGHRRAVGEQADVGGCRPCTSRSRRTASITPTTGPAGCSRPCRPGSSRSARRGRRRR